LYYYEIEGRGAFSEKFSGSGKSEIREELPKTDLIRTTNSIDRWNRAWFRVICSFKGDAKQCKYVAATRTRRLPREDPIRIDAFRVLRNEKSF